MLPSFTETAGRLCVTRLLTLGLVVSAAMPGLEIGGRHGNIVGSSKLLVKLFVF